MPYALTAFGLCRAAGESHLLYHLFLNCSQARGERTFRRLLDHSRFRQLRLCKRRHLRRETRLSTPDAAHAPRSSTLHSQLVWDYPEESKTLKRHLVLVLALALVLPLLVVSGHARLTQKGKTMPKESKPADLFVNNQSTQEGGGTGQQVQPISSRPLCHDDSH
jgi:hypothetical protein